MSQIKKVQKLTDNTYLNLFEIDGRNRKGGIVDYFIASRAKEEKEMKIYTKDLNPDGVIIYSLYGEKRDRVVLVRQYRFSINDYIYEFPAGLVDEDEDYHTAGIREMKEETGLAFQPLKVDDMYQKPYFTTIGLTDECCATVYGYASGEITRDGLEENEEIEVVLADRNEVRRILKEERISIMCAYMLMHFIKDEEPFAFLI